MPSAVWTPMPWVKSCSANSPSCSSLAMTSVTSLPAVTAWSATTSSSDPLGAEEVGQRDPVALGLARRVEPLELGLAVLGVEHDDLVALRVAGEVAEQRARVQVGLLAPHALEPRPEVLGDELLPFLALDAAAAPVELEEDVRVEVGVDLVEVDLELAHAPERRRGDGEVGAGLGADRVVGEVEDLLFLAGLAQLRGLRAHLLDELHARRALDELVHHREALERVLAVEDAGLVDVLRVLALRIVGAQAELAVDGGAADQQRVVHPALVQLGDRERHLLRGADEQRGEADGGGLVLLGGVEDRPDRDLLAEVDDRVAVVG